MWNAQHRVPGMIVMSASTAVLWFSWAAVASAGEIKVRVSWGHGSTESRPCYVRFDTQKVTLGGHIAQDLETGDKVSRRVCTTTAGAGDVDGVSLELSFADLAARDIDNLHRIWAYLIEHGDAGAARRLKQDPAYPPATALSTNSAWIDGLAFGPTTPRRTSSASILFGPMASGRGSISSTACQCW